VGTVEFLNNIRCQLSLRTQKYVKKFFYLFKSFFFFWKISIYSTNRITYYVFFNK